MDILPTALEYDQRLGYMFVSPYEHGIDLQCMTQQATDRADKAIRAIYSGYDEDVSCRNLCHQTVKAYLEAFAQWSESARRHMGHESCKEAMRLNFKRTSFIAYQHYNRLCHLLPDADCQENWGERVLSEKSSIPNSEILRKQIFGKTIGICAESFRNQTGACELGGVPHVLDDYNRDVATIFAETGWNNDSLRAIDPALAPPGNSLTIPPAIVKRGTLRAA